MSSRSATPVSVAPRRLPCQARGRQRVERLLAAAARVFAAHGYLEATMCAIASEADAAIGSLYQFYPNKEAVVEALRAQYATMLGPKWLSLTRAAPRLSAAAIARRVVALVTEGTRTCPAWAALAQAPPTVGSRRRRDLFRRRIAGVLRARAPRLSAAAALRHAAVVQQLVYGLLALPQSAEEFEEILTAFLKSRIENLQ